MKEPYKASDRNCDWFWKQLVILFVFLSGSALGVLVHAQGSSQGNTTIFAKSQMTVFANHDFTAGGSGIQPGVILTERETGGISYLNFSGNNLTASGADDANYVDGYVRKLGGGQFVFPTGDNGHVGQFAASADGTSGAYYFADPNYAITSNLFTGNNYGALPSGGPFATHHIGANVDSVSTIEYWDIDGAAGTSLTLTWDAGSGISNLTGGDLKKLTIVGWNGTEWVAIPSKFDTSAILGGATSLTAGSITSIAPVVPDTYIAYTFASLKVPLPVTMVSFSAALESITVNLSWSTSEETNSDRFEIQRSRDGKSWTTLGIVTSAKESSALRRYNFTDSLPWSGDNLYRLKMIDNDETFAYSTIRRVHFAEGHTAYTYPNPSSDRVFLNASDVNDVRELSLLDINGRTIAKTKLVGGGISVRGLSEGTYLLRVHNADGSFAVHRFLVRR